MDQTITLDPDSVASQKLSQTMMDQAKLNASGVPHPAPAPAAPIDDGKGPIPYNRFKELNDKYADAQKKLESSADYEELKRQNAQYAKYYDSVNTYVAGFVDQQHDVDSQGVPRAADDKGDLHLGSDDDPKLTALHQKIQSLEQNQKQLSEEAYQSKRNQFYARVDSILDENKIPQSHREQIRNYAIDSFTGSLTAPEESISAAAAMIDDIRKQTINEYVNAKDVDSQPLHETGYSPAISPEPTEIPVFNKLGKGTRNVALDMARQMGMGRK